MGFDPVLAANIAAILLGPIFAVLVTRWLDDRRDRRNRRYFVFATLMRTRRNPMSAEHVGALNLIEIEFAGAPEVIRRWRDYFVHLGSVHARRTEEDLTPGLSDEELKQRQERYLLRLGAERGNLRTKLLHAIAKEMRFDIEQMDIFEGGYSPEGWDNDEASQRDLREQLLKLLRKQTYLPTIAFPTEDDKKWREKIVDIFSDIAQYIRSRESSAISVSDGKDETVVEVTSNQALPRT